MAHKVYEIDLSKECPRCGCKVALVAVYHFGSTHTPSCKNCGLNNGKGDRQELAHGIMINCFYEYEQSKPKE
jgi:transcription elongation factor Elf1